MVETATAPAATEPAVPLAPPPASHVVVHPLVLLSVVDHFNRVAKSSSKRVIGVLLGESFKGRVDVTNSYAVPFEEDRKDPNVWYLDHNYHEEIFEMFKVINVKERVVGWYSTGPKIRPSDLEINELMRKYCPDPVLVIIDVNPTDDLNIPTEAYRAVENSAEDNSESRKSFVHITSTVGAFEAEEVGVEHLLRDIRDTTVSSLAQQISSKTNSLRGLEKHVNEIRTYLERVLRKEIPPNHQIIYNLQDILNLFPNLRNEDMVKAFATKTNDMYLVNYLSAMIRSIVALHNLINNKLDNKLLGEPKAAKKEADAKTADVKDKKGDKKEAGKGEKSKEKTEKKK